MSVNIHLISFANQGEFTANSIMRSCKEAGCGHKHEINDPNKYQPSEIVPPPPVRTLSHVQSPNLAISRSRAQSTMRIENKIRKRQTGMFELEREEVLRRSGCAKRNLVLCFRSGEKINFNPRLS